MWIESKTFDFAIRIVNLYKYLCDQKKEYVLSKQFCVRVQVLVLMLLKLSRHKADLTLSLKCLSH